MHVLSQSPEWGDEAVRSLALSTSDGAWGSSWVSCSFTINPSHTCCMCCWSLVGLTDPDIFNHCSSLALTDWSSSALMPSGRMHCWWVCVNAADAKIPRPPFLTAVKLEAIGCRWCPHSVSRRCLTLEYCWTDSDTAEGCHCSQMFWAGREV